MVDTRTRKAPNTVDTGAEGPTLSGRQMAKGLLNAF